MEPARGLTVARQKLTGFTDLPGDAEVVADAVGEIVGIDEVLTRVVGRIDVDHLYAVGIALAEQLEHFEVVALEHHVSCGVPVRAVREDGP